MKPKGRTKEAHRKAKARLRMLEHAEKISRNVEKTARFFGVARSSFYYWRKRYREEGYEGLFDRIRGSIRHPLKTPSHIEALILKVRKERGYGAIRLSYHLERYHAVYVSPATIHRIFRANKLPPTSQKRFRPGPKKRRPVTVPGRSVQVDVKHIRLRKKKFYQFTAIDEATRYRVLQIYDQINTRSSKHFIDEVKKRLPVAIQRIKTDNGSEFGSDFTWHLHDLGIDHRRIPPGCPQANGKVERSHRTDVEEFYRRTKFRNAKDLRKKLEAWEQEYNAKRPHMSLKGRTPEEFLAELKIRTYSVRKSP